MIAADFLYATRFDLLLDMRKDLSERWDFLLRREEERKFVGVDGIDGRGEVE